MRWERGQLEPDAFGRLRPRSVVVEEVRARVRAFRRVLAFLRLGIHDVVNCEEARLRVREAFRWSQTCHWEGERGRLERRAGQDRWTRENL